MTDLTSSSDLVDNQQQKFEKSTSYPVTRSEKASVSVSALREDTPDIDRFNHQDLDLELWAKKQDENAFETLSEKITFVILVANFGVTCYCAAGHSGFLAWFYTIKFPIYITGRFVHYTGRSWGWFMLDFCYFGNALVFAYLWVIPNRNLFTVAFAIANGPLLSAVPIFQNALVFHSLDKTASILIHISPAIIFYCFRWQFDLEFWDINHRWSDTICTQTSILNHCGSLMYAVVWPFVFTIMHQALYLIIVQWICGERIQSNPNSLTTYRYIFRHRSGPFYQFIGCLGKRFRVYVFGTTFVFFSLLSYFWAMLLFRSQWLHLFAIVFSGGIATWNGAGFYGTAFAQSKFEKKNIRSSAASETNAPQTKSKDGGHTIVALQSLTES